MSSPSQAHVPYQAYKSKRHSRTLSNQHLLPNVSPPPVSRPSNTPSGGSPLGAHVAVPSLDLSSEPEKLDLGPPQANIVSVELKDDSTLSVVHSNLPSVTHISPEPSVPILPTSAPEPDVQAPAPVSATTSPLINGKRELTASTAAGPSTSISTTPPTPTPVSRKSSTFRHIPLRSPARSPLSSSPLRPPGVHSRTSSTSSTASRSFELNQALRSSEPRSRMSSIPSSNLAVSHERALPTIPSIERLVTEHLPESAQPPSGSHVPPPRATSLPPPRPPSQSHSPSPTPPSSSPATPAPALPVVYRQSAPYRPGFQPKGVYRHLTEEFIESRTIKRDVGRIERTKLERRLEKLISLHFSNDEKHAVELGRPAGNRRVSSFFNLEISDIKNMDAGELWRGVIQSQALQGSKGDIRAAEQRITPWEDDASVSKCPLCSASFHSLTNRKHHCRLCGQIICSLPVKRPQRTVACSLLFIVDPQTRKIEEVGEGVDYGVRKRKSVPAERRGKEREEALGDDEKFLKGVRICRECRPVLLRQQYQQEITHVPTFARLYEAFISLEKEIEDSLPQFQELLLTLSHDDQPTKEASMARKRLLEAFAQYDGLSKRIRKLPCPSGPGSSQDRVQIAVLTRANLFLQKNMFPLQSLPKPKSKATASPASQEEPPLIDPDSELALALQPLLEQEALLESFVEEAKAHRKFEDVKTLKANLAEIRHEIDKIVANSEGGMTKGNGNAKK